jgi:hypothetical protein
MTHSTRPASAVREASTFTSPPRVRILARDADMADDALALAEALDGCGAEAEVRVGALGGDTDHVHPDAFVVELGSGVGLLRATGHAPVLVAVADRDGREERHRARAEGFDVLVARPIDPSALLHKVGEVMTKSGG